LTNNCEHFCEWCLRGTPRSHQIEALLMQPRRALHAMSGLIAWVVQLTARRVFTAFSRTRSTNPAQTPLSPQRGGRGPRRRPGLPDIERSWNTRIRPRTEGISPCRRSRHLPCSRAPSRWDPIPTPAARNPARQQHKHRR
jgi:hypothetical protein